MIHNCDERCTFLLDKKYLEEIFELGEVEHAVLRIKGGYRIYNTFLLLFTPLSLILTTFTATLVPNFLQLFDINGVGEALLKLAG